MKQEVVEDFLNLPGIAGVALMDRRSRPYFCGIDSTLNFQQKTALAQGIRQVVETTPEGFESFEFQFTGHQVYIYKLADNMILLVLANSNLVYANYLSAVEKLKTALQEDVTTAIATFRLLAGNVTLSNQTYWKPSGDDRTASGPTKTASASQPTRNRYSPTRSPTSTGSRNGFKTSAEKPPPVTSQANLKPETPSPHGNDPVSASTASSQVTLKELLATLNHLSQFTTEYLGTAVIANYWKSSRPDIDWLDNFQVSRKAEITLSGSVPEAISESETVSREQIQGIHSWVAAFIERCTKVIRDFPVLVKQKALNPRQQELLLPEDETIG